MDLIIKAIYDVNDINEVNDIVLVSFMLALNIFHTFFSCFYC